MGYFILFLDAHFSECSRVARWLAGNEDRIEPETLISPLFECDDAIDAANEHLNFSSFPQVQARACLEIRITLTCIWNFFHEFQDALAIEHFLHFCRENAWKAVQCWYE